MTRKPTLTTKERGSETGRVVVPDDTLLPLTEQDLAHGREVADRFTALAKARGWDKGALPLADCLPEAALKHLRTLPLVDALDIAYGAGRKIIEAKEAGNAGRVLGGGNSGDKKKKAAREACEQVARDAIAKLGFNRLKSVKAGGERTQTQHGLDVIELKNDDPKLAKKIAAWRKRQRGPSDAGWFDPRTRRAVIEAFERTAAVKRQLAWLDDLAKERLL